MLTYFRDLNLRSVHGVLNGVASIQAGIAMVKILTSGISATEWSMVMHGCQQHYGNYDLHYIKRRNEGILVIRTLLQKSL
jgi:hypothetical protein